MTKIDFQKIKKAAITSLKNPGKCLSLPKTKEGKYSTLYVFRHSQTFDNIRRVFSGRRNSKLTPEGIRQAKRLANLLKSKKIDFFISSPLSRCLETLEEVRVFHKQVSLVKEPLLLERDYGKLTGKSKTKLMRKSLEKAILYRRSYDFPPPGGESLKEVQIKRVFPFCGKLVKKMRSEKINVAVCCTNNTMRLIRMYFERLSIEEMLTLENSFEDYASFSVR